MDCVTYDPYTLPTIEFVGGEKQDFIFNLFFHSEDKPLIMYNVAAQFSVVSYLNKNGAAILTKAMAAVKDANGMFTNSLSVTLTPEDTVGLSGKFIYQITIRDKDTGTVEIPKQGIMLVINNIDKGFISANRGV